MKKIIQYSILIGLIIGFSAWLQAQDKPLPQAFKKQTVERLSELMNRHYVFPEVAQKTGEHIKAKLAEGFFDEFTTLTSFGEALTKEVQTINKDKHMRVRPAPTFDEAPDSPERMIEERLREIERRRNSTAGFREVKKLDGNVGYLDLRGFAPLHLGRPIADSYMQLMASSDAIIVDLRKNGGGSPAMVQYLCSYFFDQHLHLNSLYSRERNHTEEFWTLDEVEGVKMPDIPLFILTSNYTFSAAEEFSYNMQTQKRATLVGETTGGGANPGGGFPLNEKLMVFIPTGKAINPITGTNWEGVGVVPEVKTSAEEAFDKGYELAKDAAEKYRVNKKEKGKKIFSQLQKQLAGFNAHASEEKLIATIKECQKVGILDEPSINMMGYDHFQRENNPALAEVIFKANTLLYPEEANVYDSYAEVLTANGKKAEAIKNFTKAVELAKANEHPNLELFQENLNRAKK